MASLSCNSQAVVELRRGMGCRAQGHIAAFCRQGYLVSTLFLQFLTSFLDQALPPSVVPENLDAVPPALGMCAARAPPCGPLLQRAVQFEQSLN